MDDYKQIILGAEPGQIVPIVKRIDMEEPVDFFAKLSESDKTGSPKSSPAIANRTG